MKCFLGNKMYTCDVIIVFNKKMWISPGAV